MQSTGFLSTVWFKECCYMISIMLVDDQPAILAGLIALVEATNIAHVVATEAVVSSAIEHKPDLILLDVSLGKDSGIDVARQLFEHWKDARVLAVSAHSDSFYVRSMLKAGASGYMLKDNGPAEIVNAITTIMEGGQWIGSGLSYNSA